MQHDVEFSAVTGGSYQECTECIIDGFTRSVGTRQVGPLYSPSLCGYFFRSDVAVVNRSRVRERRRQLLHPCPRFLPLQTPLRVE